MNVAVLVKQVPDPNQTYKLRADNRLDREGIQGVLDPGDEFGVEAGLRLTETAGGEVTVVCMGPAKAMEAVRRALSMGAHKAVLVTDDEALPGADALATARVLAAAIARNPFDLVIGATESTDGSSGVVVPMIAELLGVPHVTYAKHLEVKDGSILVQRQTVAGHDVVECPMPAVVSVTAGVNQPRYPTFKGIMQAKTKPVEQVTVASLGVSPEDAKASQWIEAIHPAPERGKGEVVEDDGSAPARIADFLKSVKVI